MTTFISQVPKVSLLQEEKASKIGYGLLVWLGRKLLPCSERRFKICSVFTTLRNMKASSQWVI